MKIAAAWADNFPASHEPRSYVTTRKEVNEEWLE